MPQIREAKLHDSEVINRLSENLGYEFISQEDANRNIGEIIDSENQKLWLSDEDNQVVGWIHIFKANRVASRPFCEIGGLVVSSEHRRKGIGSGLVKHAIEWSKLHGLPLRVRSNTKRNNTIEFYQSQGFILKKSQNVLEISL